MFIAASDGVAASAMPAPSLEGTAKSGRSGEGGRGGRKKYLPVLDVLFQFCDIIFLFYHTINKLKVSCSHDKLHF